MLTNAVHAIESSPCRVPGSRAARLALPGALVMSLAAFAASAIALPGPNAVTGREAPASQAKSGKSDQISVKNKRDGSPQLVAGVVTANSLDQVTVQVAGKDTKFDSSLVVRITWGDVPSSFKDGRVYFNRSQFGEASAQFRLAAGDASARDVVKAAARLWAAQSLLRWGAADPLHFGEAAEEATKFLTDHATNRDVPEARMLQARARWLAGQAADAAQIYKAVYSEWKGTEGTPGYRRELCFEAGLQAARALCQIQPPDTLGARELYSSLEKAAGDALGALEAAAPGRAQLRRFQDEAVAGPGFVELAGGNARQATTFFQGKLTGKDQSDTLRYAASYGLAQALLAGGKLREAQLEFARVSALEHSDRDRAALAQVGLADVTLKLADPDATPQARAWLEGVIQSQGDTLAAPKAREMLKKL